MKPDLTIRVLDGDGRTLMRVDPGGDWRVGGPEVIELPEGARFMRYGPSEPINPDGIMADEPISVP